MITMKPRKKWNYSRKKKIGYQSKDIFVTQIVYLLFKGITSFVKLFKTFVEVEQIAINHVQYGITSRGIFSITCLLLGQFQSDGDRLTPRRRNYVTVRKVIGGGGGLRFMEINRNIKESHKKKTWTFRLIVFWGALWMAIYSLPFPPSLWRKLFCKLIIQICQNARIRTIYMAEILFVVSTR